jgi:hypothetical protein
VLVLIVIKCRRKFCYLVKHFYRSRLKVCKQQERFQPSTATMAGTKKKSNTNDAAPRRGSHASRALRAAHESETGIAVIPYHLAFLDFDLMEDGSGMIAVIHYHLVFLDFHYGRSRYHTR